jgi:hypothetical protein
MENASTRHRNTRTDHFYNFINDKLEQISTAIFAQHSIGVSVLKEEQDSYVVIEAGKSYFNDNSLSFESVEQSNRELFEDLNFSTNNSNFDSNYKQLKF